MRYEFKQEDFELCYLLESMEISPYLRSFVKNHDSKIKKSFEDMIKEMKEEEKTKMDDEFIKELDEKEFFYVVKVTLQIMFAKDFMELAKAKEVEKLEALILGAQNLAFKMSKDSQNPIYIEQVEKIISICHDSILRSYRQSSI